jgi:hypothetical protein
MKTLDEALWHQLQAEEVVRLLDVDLKTGLSDEEVKRRQEKYGPNSVTPTVFSRGPDLLNKERGRILV